MARAAVWIGTAFWLATLAGGCAQQIGDECETGLDCSSQGTRLCDLTLRGGYCTLPGCEQGTCPDEAVCVAFRPSTPRLAVSYCMLECEDSGDCRADEGYRCLREGDFGVDGAMEASVLDGSGKRFCGLPASISVIDLDGEMEGTDDTEGDGDDDPAGPDAGASEPPVPDGGMSLPDASAGAG